MNPLDEETQEMISDLEMALVSYARHPAHIELDEKVGPYTLKRVWFDELDGQPTLGVTWQEDSVKSDKKMHIFKPVRTGTPVVLVELWRKSIFVLIQEIAKQHKARLIPEEIQDLVQELQENR